MSRILSDGTDCALNGGCYIGTQDSAGVGPAAARIIKFDPNIPPLPQLEISLRWDKSPQVNAKGVVALKGSLHCANKGGVVEIDADLRQIFDRSIFESYGYTDIACAADSTTPFRITIRPQNGLFGPGDANVRFQAFSFDGEAYAFGRRNLTLVGKHLAAAGDPASAKPATWH